MRKETKSPDLVYLKPDSRNRVALTKITEHLSSLYRAYSRDGKIILEPVVEIPNEEAWLFLPENKEKLEYLKKSLKQKADIDLGSFKKYVKKSK